MHSERKLMLRDLKKRWRSRKSRKNKLNQTLR